MWLRHEVNVWHLDCEIRQGKHDFIASVTRREEEIELFIPPSTKKMFRSNKELNDYVRVLEIEEVNITE